MIVEHEAGSCRAVTANSPLGSIIWTSLSADLEYCGAGCGGPVLEPAVGNGRIFIPLLEAGLALEGLDASQDMPDYCRQECRSRGASCRIDLPDARAVAL